MSRRRWGAAALAVGALSASLAVAPANADVETNGHHGYSKTRTVGYFIQWGVYDRNFRVKNLVDSGAAARLTHLNYAFGFLDESGKCVSADPWADWQMPHTAEQSVSGKADEAGQVLAGNLNQLKQLKAKYPRLRINISLGGWTGSRYFSNAALTPESRAAHVKSCTDMWIKGNLPGLPEGAAKGVFDGIDLDWEWPGSNGNMTPPNVVRPEDKQNFTKLLAEYRRQMGWNRDLTAFLPADPKQVDAGFEVRKVFCYLTFGTLQGYDYHGAWDAAANQQSALRVPKGDPSEFEFSSEVTVNAWLSRGAPRSKAVLGVPFYGRGWDGVAPGTRNGLFGTGVPAPAKYEAGYEDFHRIKAKLSEPGNTYKIYRDEKAGFAWIYDGKTWWTYDDATEMKRKARYINDRRLGGAMIWSLDGDTPQGELIKALDGALK
ncbi:glycoside hydrolase family 18 protein [Lentzea sp. NEAU-D7]|uniref:glycoside hydrolase family 18 protein n=1 Tax=Lentzea sp. NEAU-D7 TaxID=2994667 RepID=UPI00224AE3BC|nr:glycoside hydrolase family 18 protein [Lentzea sp. NEAU-D7]MCX2950670.1 glycoside hydrolase family 18 protein [Lentzea sp. NEAU-D7]